ncbi:MAG: MoxR family ATPase [Lachnospiraceae bacterium]|nr:MoxR family ATPase [Lachnospiraceae bacterium]
MDGRRRIILKSHEKAAKIIGEVEKVILGKDECVEKVMAAILAGGHVLIEDIPGVGKTSMALAFARAMGIRQNRVQFTPDVLPTDIVGFSMYRKELDRFEYQDGAVMCNLFLADEINRTSPKTQSALLEVMEEETVTVDGITREVPKPFHVIATENPIGSIGTQMLPESQLDRFIICILIGYPNKEEEIKMLLSRDNANPMNHIKSVINGDELIAMQKQVDDIFIHEKVYEYIVDLVNETRNHEMIELGISPRGSLALAKMSKAMAYLNGRDYVVPTDVSDVFGDVVYHRLLLSSKGKLNNMTIEDVTKDVLNRVKKPAPQYRK